MQIRPRPSKQSQPQTFNPNLKPQTPNPKPQTPNSKPQTASCRALLMHWRDHVTCRSSCPLHRGSSLGCSGAAAGCDPQTFEHKPQNTNPKPSTPNLKPQTSNPKPSISGTCATRQIGPRPIDSLPSPPLPRLWLHV